MPSDDHQRLDRIEQKIDSMSEAVVSLARAEEKIISLGETTNRILNRLVDYEKRMRDVEQKTINSQQRLKSFTTFTWTVVTAITTTVIGYFAYILKR